MAAERPRTSPVLAATAVPLVSVGELQETQAFPDIESHSQSCSSWKASKRKPGARWDGRVSSLTLEEYRSLKWSKEASMRFSVKQGPSYTIRGLLPTRIRSMPNLQRLTDVCKALDMVKPKAPTFTMGLSLIGGFEDQSPGPLQYKVPSTMDPKPHPTIRKSTGPRFGGEAPLCNDEERPGPGQYSTENYQATGRVKRCASYTIQGREAWFPSTAPPAPGVGEYKVAGLTNKGAVTSSKWTMCTKGSSGDQMASAAVVFPGPAHYNVPGAGSRNKYVAAQRPVAWKWGTDERGLI